MKKHIKIALIVASCLSIGATFLAIHPSQAFFLDLPPKENRISQSTDKQSVKDNKQNSSIKQDLPIVKKDMLDTQSNSEKKKNPSPDNAQKEKQVPEKDSMKKTQENKKEHTPNDQSKVSPDKSIIPPAVKE